MEGNKKNFRDFCDFCVTLKRSAHGEKQEKFP